MTYTDPQPSTTDPVIEDIPHRRAWWPLVASAAGAAGIVGTLLTDLHVDDPDATMNAAMIADVDPTTARIGFYAGYLTVGLLLVFGACWRRHVEPRVPGSSAARVVSSGLTAAAGALILGYGWKGAVAIYFEGGPEDTAVDAQGQFIYLMLNDFGSFFGWTGVLVSACAIAWMSFRERTVSYWLGIVTALLAVATIGAMLVMSVPGIPGISMPLWLGILGLGLVFGKSTITR